jgi:ESS family glutamate:Na+ symporter
MPAPFPFDAMLIFAFLSALLLAGVLLRAKVAVLQRYLFPSCLVGGVLGLVVLQAGFMRFDISTIEAFAYHFFNISFISVGLTPGTDAGDSGKGKKLRGPTWMALMQGLTFPLQACLGGLLVIAFGLMGTSLFPTFGFLVPLGFNEGPGQALSIGKAWEGLGFTNAATIGLTFAAVGYFFAFFVGVPLVNRGIRRGEATHGPQELPRDFLTGILARNGPKASAGRLTLHTGNAETLALQTALVGIVYGITYLIVLGLGSLMPADAATILWGFFFLLGLCVALSVKKLLAAMGINYLMDPGIQRRITGWSVDYLIVATVVAIQLQVVWTYIVPIAVIAVLNGIATTALVMWFGRRLDGYNLERTAAIYGTVTGTVSCGLLLLRIVDPEFKTPVAFEIAIMNVIVVPIVGGGTVLVNGPLWWDWSVGLTVLVFAGIGGVCLVLMRLLKFWGVPSAQ